MISVPYEAAPMRPLLEPVHVTPALVLLKTPAEVAAYRSAGFDGSAMTERTAPPYGPFETQGAAAAWVAVAPRAPTRTTSPIRTRVMRAEPVLPAMAAPQRR